MKLRRPWELWLTAEPLKLELIGEPSEMLYHVHSIIAAVWMSGEVPQAWKYAIIKVLRKKRAECRSYRGTSLVWHMLVKLSSNS